MSEIPSKSNADIDRPRRSIARFLWLNAIWTSALAVALGLTFDHVYLLYPAVFSCLVLGVVLIFREMFALLGEDSQYSPDPDDHPHAHAV